MTKHANRRIISDTCRVADELLILPPQLSAGSLDELTELSVQPACLACFRFRGNRVWVFGGTHANKHAGMHVHKESGSIGMLVGIYSGAALEGVVTHPKERFHLHVVDRDLTRSGHIDDYTVSAGAVLYLPRAC